MDALVNALRRDVFQVEDAGFRERFRLVPGRPLDEQVREWSKGLSFAITRGLTHGAPFGGTWMLQDRRGRVESASCALFQEAEGVWHFRVQAHADPSVADMRHAYLLQEQLGWNNILAELAASAGSARESLSRCVPSVMAAMNMEAAALYVLDDTGRAELITAHGKTRRRGLPYPGFDLPQNSLGPLLGLRMLELPRIPDDVRALRSVACHRMRQLLLVPCSIENRLNGILVLSRRLSEPISPLDAGWLESVGRMLGLIIRDHMLSTRGEQSATVLQTAYAVSKTISQSLDLEKTFKVIAVNAARLVEGSKCLLLKRDASSLDLVSVACSEPDDAGLLGLRIRFKDENALLTDHLEFEVQDLIPNRHVDPALAGRLEMDSAILLPMLVQNVPIGALLVYSRGDVRKYSPEELALVHEVAEQAAVAIHNARLYGDLADSEQRIENLLMRITRIREYERQRIASVVHDDILQAIVAAVFELESIRISLPAASNQTLDEVLALLRSTVDDGRSIITDLRPPMLQEVGLAEALRALVSRANVEGSPYVSLSIDTEAEVSYSRSEALYKIAREALMNARRHADARHVALRLQVVKRDGVDWLGLSVLDDGIGLPAAGRPDTEHFGLTMMEEQAALVAGWLELQSPEGGGTSVEAGVPLRYKD